MVISAHLALRLERLSTLAKARTPGFAVVSMRLPPSGRFAHLHPYIVTYSRPILVTPVTGGCHSARPVSRAQNSGFVSSRSQPSFPPAPRTGRGSMDFGQFLWDYSEERQNQCGNGMVVNQYILYSHVQCLFAGHHAGLVRK